MHIDEEHVICYKAKNGFTYRGIAPDMDTQPWFKDLVDSNDLKSLVEKYPYQPLRLNEKTNRLEPMRKGVKYNALITNSFHVLYHMRMDEAAERLEKEQEELLKQQNCSCANHTNNPSVPSQGYYNFMNLVVKDTADAAVKVNLEDAYDRTEREVKYVDPNLHSYVNNGAPNPGEYNFAFTGAQLNTTPVETNGWHPRTAVPNSTIPNYGYAPMQPQMPGMMVPPPAFNQGTYLPQYRQQAAFDNPSVNMEQQGFSCFEDARQLRDAHMAAQTQAAIDTYNRARMENPTLLDTDNVVDFSNPASVASMQQPMYYGNGQYAQPQMAPQMQYQMQQPMYAYPPQQPIYPQQQYAYPPYVQQPMYQQNPYMNNYNGFQFYSPFRSSLGYVDPSQYMIPTRDEIDRGEACGVSVVRINKGDVLETVGKPDDDCIDFREAFKAPIKVTVVRGTGENAKPVTTTKESKEFSKDSMKAKFDTDFKDRGILNTINAIKNGTVEVARQLSVYDEIMANQLLESMSIDPPEEFEIFKEACVEKLERLQKEELEHPELNYRLPEGAKPVPPTHVVFGERIPMEIPELPPRPRQYDTNGNEIPVKYKENTPEEMAIKKQVKDMQKRRIIEAKKPRAKTEEELLLDAELEAGMKEFERHLMRERKEKELDRKKEQLDAEISMMDPNNPYTRYIREAKVRERQQLDQYDIYRLIFKSSMSDEQFDKWWYGNSADAPDSVVSVEEKRKRWKEQMLENNINFLNTLAPVDWESVVNRNRYVANKAIRDFDGGCMDGCETLKEYFQNFGTLVRKSYDYDLKEYKLQNASNVYSQTRFYDALYRFGNEGGPAPNPFNVHAKPMDGNPEMLDFLNSEEYSKKLDQFLHYCDTNPSLKATLKPFTH